MKTILFSTSMILALVAFVFAQQKPPKSNDVAAFMQLKLDHSKEVLEGIVLEDYDQISKHAQQLSLLSEDETWQVFQTLEYLRHSNEFRRATEALSSAARERNIDGATLAYMDMTLQCVNCHKYVRDVRMASRHQDRWRR